MSCINELNALAAMSQKYGANSSFVLAGGGNTSYKSDEILYVKGSGTALATIKPEQFVKMDRALLAKMWETDYPADEAAREAAVLADMMDARVKNEMGRPSVETLLHDLFPQRYVLHVHPAAINGITCSVKGKAAMAELFPDAVWVDACKPGYILAGNCREAMNAVVKAGKPFPNLLFLENHGIFFAADTTEEIDTLAANVMDSVYCALKRSPDLDDCDFDAERAVALAPVVRMLYGEGGVATATFVCNKEILAFDIASKSATPDHIVYTKAKVLGLPADVTDDGLAEAFRAFVAENGYKPKIIIVEGLGMYACGKTYSEAMTAKEVFLDALTVMAYAESFGGFSPMSDELIDFIVNWEVESYRAKVSLASASAKRLEGKVTIVTGGAQGFGKGIADELYKDGAYLVIADMNEVGATAAALDFAPTGYPVAVNVSDEESVKKMVYATVLRFGGLDILVSNAGIAKAGGLEEMTKSVFELVTAVNYTGYFLCTKYAAQIMKIQNKFAPDYMMDIITVNSKSGLAGSNKNFAYAGSKFGGIGLTQSFALELAPVNVKVNAVCPGNFLDGPLWSDPERGLFVQYLNAGKVPGAKTVEDVRKFYESKVPMNRGCLPKDVACAITYLVEQKYETGQALPVTGGQEMLN